ncbi:choice-of-anchor D domain-containing protein [Nocardioides sp. AE5]|uniref:choice-of-anchor D domain-containing protein n=1 Tax=Nocardioides sp. AE5 TaxID=2962573 RepID=UPI0028817513|nr:choice-of-anchor D domain-containing protein [Nocardioides sp. AE5]MDT0203842.1 choice-of-anchor D domain-containing protein [Nocardioides sp. AE5]
MPTLTLPPIAPNWLPRFLFALVLALTGVVVMPVVTATAPSASAATIPAYVVFSSNRHDDASLDLYRMNIDGSGLRALTPLGDSTADTDPAISPDGNILFAQQQALALLTADGEHVRTLRSGVQDFAVPMDGSGILLASRIWTGSEARGRMVFFEDLTKLGDDNYVPHEVHSGSGGVHSPTYGADGRILHTHDPEFWLFETTDNDITVLNADASGRTKLTSGGSNDTKPDWYTGTPPPPARPTATLTQAPSGVVTDTRPEIKFAADQVGTFECRLYSRSSGATIPPFERCSDPWAKQGSFRPTPALTHGAWAFQVRVVAVSGQVSPTLSRNFSVDTGDGPDLVVPARLDFGETVATNTTQSRVVVKNEGRGSYSGFLTLEGTHAADFAVVNNSCGGALIRIEVAASSSCTVHLEFTPSALGERTATLVLEPNSSTMAYHRIQLVGVGVGPRPAAPSLTNPTALTNDATPEFPFVPGDAETTDFECRVSLEGETPPAFGACSGPRAHTPAVELPDGTHLLEVRGVWPGSPAVHGPAVEHTFIVDTVAPVVEIVSAPTVTDDTTPRFVFTANERVTWQCRVFASGATPPEFTPCVGIGSNHNVVDPLPEGDHSFEVRAYDYAGNLSEVQRADFTVGTVSLPDLPVAVITGPDSLDEGSTLTLSATTSTGTGPLSYTWDTDNDGTPDATGPSITIPAPRHGTLDITLTVTDTDNNTATTTHHVTVNNVAPTLAPIADQDLAHDTALTLIGSFTDPGTNTWTATVDYGNGPTPLTLNGKEFTLTHDQPTNGTTATIRICDDADACDQTTFTITVQPAPQPEPPASPSVSSLTPDSGAAEGGTEVTIVGTGLLLANALANARSISPMALAPGLSVTFGGQPATNVDCTTSGGVDTCTMLTPPGTAGIVDVVVTTAGGTAMLTGAFTYVAPVDPTDPTDPVDPSDPAEPVDPVDPVDIATPGDTTAPERGAQVRTAGNATYLPPTGASAQDWHITGGAALLLLGALLLVRTRRRA